MKTRSFVIILCLSFLLLITASNATLAQQGTYQTGIYYTVGSGGSYFQGIGGGIYPIDQKVGGFSSQVHLMPGVLYNLEHGEGRIPVVPQTLTSNAQVNIMAGVRVNVAQGYPLPSDSGSNASGPGTGSVRESRGVQMAAYYDLSPWMNSFIELGDYTRDLQFKTMEYTTAPPAASMPYGYPGIEMPKIPYPPIIYPVPIVIEYPYPQPRLPIQFPPIYTDFEF